MYIGVLAQTRNIAECAAAKNAEVKQLQAAIVYFKGGKKWKKTLGKSEKTTTKKNLKVPF